MPNMPSNSKISGLDLIDPDDTVSDVYYSLDDAEQVAKEFPKLERGVLKILEEEYSNGEIR